MLIKIKRGWELPDSAATPESFFRNRRALLKAAIAAPAIAAVGPMSRAFADDEPEVDPTASLYPVAQNGKFVLDRPLTPEKLATTYNNYYEFGSFKEIWKKAPSWMEQQGSELSGKLFYQIGRASCRERV